MRSQDDELKEPAAIALSTPLTLLMPQRYVGGQTLPNTCYLQDDVPCVPAGTPVGPLPPPRAAEPAAVSSATTIAPPPAATEEKPKFNVSAQDYGDSLSALLTHPTAIFVTDVKVTPFKLVKKKARNNGPSEEMPGNTKPEAKEAETSDSPNIEIQAGMVVSLGPDAARLHAKFIKYLKKARKAGADADFAQIKIDGKPWYRSKPSGPGDKNRVTFGFHGKYFVVGVGRGAVEGILARWNSPTPAWLAKALEQTQVPRRTGIIYLNLKALRDKLLPLAPSKIEALAVLKLLGLDNVDSLISTTGLEDYGMINRVHLALDGKPRGLLDMVADRPLAAKDLEPIPSDALLAVAARVDLDRVLKALIAAYETAAGDADARKAVEEMKKEYGVDVHRFLSSLGDTWCVYNSPTEGEIAFLGWTAVVPVRDRAVLLESWEKLCAAEEKKEAKKDDAKDKNSGDPKVPENTQTAEFCKCRFAGHEIYYVAGAAIAPAFYVSDREMVMTLNMPAMKAYLARKDHRSLATLPGVALALNDQNRPVALGYCDTPKLFDFLYPLISLYATMGAAAVHEAKIDLDPTFWPSAPAIRAHLRPDITTVERTPHGLQLTCRYCLPTGGANGPLWLIGLGILGSSFSEPGNLLSPGIAVAGMCHPLYGAYCSASFAGNAELRSESKLGRRALRHVAPVDVLRKLSIIRLHHGAGGAELRRFCNSRKRGPAASGRVELCRSFGGRHRHQCVGSFDTAELLRRLWSKRSGGQVNGKFGPQRNGKSEQSVRHCSGKPVQSVRYASGRSVRYANDKLKPYFTSNYARQRSRNSVPQHNESLLLRSGGSVLWPGGKSVDRRRRNDPRCRGDDPRGGR